MLSQLGLAYGWVWGGDDRQAPDPAAGDWDQAIAQGRSIAVVQETGWELWREELPEFHPLVWLQAADLEPAAIGGLGSDWAAVLWISDRRPPQDLPMPVLAWHPRTLWIGVGCQRGTSAQLIERAIRETCQTHGWAEVAIAGLASIDRKVDEGGLLAVAAAHGWPIRWYGADRLRSIAVPETDPPAKPQVAAITGTASVSSAAAIAAVQAGPRVGRFWQDLAGGEIVVAKQIVRPRLDQLDREPAELGTCTIAIARAAVEYNPQLGRLTVWAGGDRSGPDLGPRPGDGTPEIVTALGQAQAVLGDMAAIAALAGHCHDNQLIEPTPADQHDRRLQRAIGLIQRGWQVIWAADRLTPDLIADFERSIGPARPTDSGNLLVYQPEPDPDDRAIDPT